MYGKRKKKHFSFRCYYSDSWELTISQIFSQLDLIMQFNRRAIGVLSAILEQNHRYWVANIWWLHPQSYFARIIRIHLKCCPTSLCGNFVQTFGTYRNLLGVYKAKHCPTNSITFFWWGSGFVPEVTAAKSHTVSVGLPQMTHYTYLRPLIPPQRPSTEGKNCSNNNKNRLDICVGNTVCVVGVGLAAYCELIGSSVGLIFFTADVFSYILVLCASVWSLEYDFISLMCPEYVTREAATRHVNQLHEPLGQN